MSDVTIYHNPKCGTSRNTLAMIRNAGIEPQVAVPGNPALARATEGAVQARRRRRARRAARKGHALCRAGPGQSSAGRRGPAGRHRGASHPAEPPFVSTPLGARLCRPSELVLDILPAPQQGAFTKEDGEAVIDAQGKRIQK